MTREYGMCHAKVWRNSTQRYDHCGNWAVDEDGFCCRHHPEATTTQAEPHPTRQPFRDPVAEALWGKKKGRSL